MYILYYCINIISKKMYIYIYIYIYICICILGEIQRQKSTNPVLYFRPPLPPCTFAKGGGILTGMILQVSPKHTYYAEVWGDLNPSFFVGNLPKRQLLGKQNIHSTVRLHRFLNCQEIHVYGFVVASCCCCCRWWWWWLLLLLLLLLVVVAAASCCCCQLLLAFVCFLDTP